MSYIEERRQEERDRRRSDIIDAAEALYAESGWDAATMNQFARKARLSRALIYVYFHDKTDLHYAIVERALERLRDRAAAAVATRELGIDRLEAAGRAYMAFADEEPHRFDACARFQAQPPAADGNPSAADSCMQMGHQVHEIIAQAIERGVADGSIRSDIGDPYKTALALWAFTHGTIQIAKTKALQIHHEGIEIPALMDHAVAMIRRSLQP